MERVGGIKEVGVGGGKLMRHIRELVSENWQATDKQLTSISLMETWRWRRMWRWFWLEYYKGTDKENACNFIKMPTCWWEKGKKTHHLLIMLTKHNYANCHHDHMCTSLGLVGVRFLSEVGGKWVLHFYLFPFFLLYKHFHGHVIIVVPKTWEVQC